MRNVIQKFIELEKVATRAILVFYLFGIFFHLLPRSKNFVVGLTESALLLSNTLIIIYIILQNKRKLNVFLWILITVSITLLVEILGVHTGKIFGQYFYGETMKAKVCKVPLLIGVNWVVLILASFQFSLKFTKAKFLRPFIAGIILVLFDYVMEPVAIQLDYWKWKNGEIPLQNYIAWFVLTVFFTFLLVVLKVKTSSKILVRYFLIQLLFFLILNIFLM